jgi:hypothetical protein
MKKLLLVVCIAGFTAVSCKKDNTAESSNTVCTTATVHYGGDPNVDGLGWILVTDSVSYKYEAPENLNASFKTEGLLVDVCYIFSDNDFVCFCPPPVKKMIIITSIKNH